jgi:hypothetical protein
MFERLLSALEDATFDGELSDPEERKLGPFARDSETSRKAALAAYPRQGTQRWKILAALRYRESFVPPSGLLGYTRDELAEATGMSPNAVRPRVVELVAGGWIEESEFTRKTEAGLDASLLVLTDKAREELRRRASSGESG